MTPKDRPDWWKNVGGQNSQDSTLERRSTIWNDNEVETPVAPPSDFTNQPRYGKFFTRGARGLLERIEIYSQGDAAGTIILWVSPHPCLGPIHQITITPGVAWDWYGADIEEMWDYDSLFIWVNTCDLACSYGYDTEEPYDCHLTADGGITWDDRDLRLFIRAIYTGETPGDVPISGIINNIVIPNTSSAQADTARAYTAPAELNFLQIYGIGDVDMIILRVRAAAGSHNSRWRIYCDQVAAFDMELVVLNGLGFAATTPSVTQLQYGVNAACTIIITRKFQFRNSLTISITNAANQVVDVWAYPNLLG